MIEIEVRRKYLVEKILNNICKQDAFICGGFARVACSPNNTPIASKDIDIYLLDEKNYDVVKQRILDNYYIQVKENDVSTVFKNAIDSDNTYEVNLIKPLKTGHLHTVGDIDEILTNFDFTIARVGVYLDSNNEICGKCDEDFSQDETNKILRIKNIHCPIAEVTRVSKYVSKGYHIPIREILNILIDWDNRDDEYRFEMMKLLQDKKELNNEDVQELYRRLYVD